MPPAASSSSYLVSQAQVDGEIPTVTSSLGQIWEMSHISSLAIHPRGFFT